MPFLLQVMWARPSAASAALPVRPSWAQIDQHQMVVRAAGDDAEAAVGERLGQRLGVVDHLLRIGLEPGLQRFAESHRLGGDDMHQRAALQAGEDGRIDLLGDILVVGQHDAAARAAQGLVRRRGDDMGVRERRGMRAARHQTGEMRHIDHEIGADRIGDLAEAWRNPRSGNRPSRRR
jgi:hypothetical protein